jgi:hypothetical protein
LLHVIAAATPAPPHGSPGQRQVQALNTLLDEVVAWSTALAPLRQLQPVA